MKSNLITAALVLCIATLASVHASPNPSCRQYNIERKICIDKADDVSTKDCICNSEKLQTLYNECNGIDVDSELFFITELCNSKINVKKSTNTDSSFDNLMKRQNTIEQNKIAPKEEPKEQEKEEPKEQPKEQEKEAPKEEPKEAPKEQEQKVEIKLPEVPEVKSKVPKGKSVKKIVVKKTRVIKLKKVKAIKTFKGKEQKQEKDIKFTIPKKVKAIKTLKGKEQKQDKDIKVTQPFRLKIGRKQFGRRIGRKLGHGFKHKPF
ncbi:14114_t:CDS:1 [Funneliformis geosporum]|uniref:16808_t:CDS:1 n=1 Tax=Funneliformis geosporum TaxID=1117311 RepID=A0A9W4WX86_9GLOM|nr:16808_t:CDS:1 [Funneliformis geosporum]CAI2186110.1 14114_t:CDS:1 [Funneliformis geosporum]